MAELTTLEEKLAEVTGLAMAAQGAGEKVSGLVDDDDLRQTLDRMVMEAKETEARCTELAEELDGKKTAVLEKARETKQEATEMMRTYLGSDAEGLDGFEFLVMAEAGEVGHWEVAGGARPEGRQAGCPAARGLGDPDPAAPLPGRPRRLAQACGRGGSERGRVGANRSRPGRAASRPG